MLMGRIVSEGDTQFRLPIGRGIRIYHHGQSMRNNSIDPELLAVAGWQQLV